MKTFIVIIFSHSWYPRFIFDCVINKIICSSFVNVESGRRFLCLDIRIQWFIRCWWKTLFLNWFWRWCFINCCCSHFCINSSIILFIIWSWLFSFYSTFINVSTSVWAVLKASFNTFILCRKAFLVGTNIRKFVFFHLVNQFFSVGNSWRLWCQNVCFVV